MAGSTEKAPAPLSRGRGIVQFVREVFIELKKTTWPTWREAWRLTTVVIAVILAVAAYVGAIDWVLTSLTRHFNLVK